MKAASRYAPSSFQHNARMAAVLLPSILTLVGFGGKLSSGIFITGAMVTYIMDAMRFRSCAMGAIWITLGLVNLSMMVSDASFGGLSPLPLAALVSLLSGALLFLVGVWALLQFKWLQLQYPVVALAFEKLLLGACFPVGAAVLSWGCLAAVGPTQMPFYQAALLAGMYYMLAMPLESSFKPRLAGGRGDSSAGPGRSHERRVADGVRVQAPLEGALAAVLTALLPAATYLAAHARTLGRAEHLWSLLLLGCAPALFIACLEEGLWWLPLRRRHREALRTTLLVTSLAGALAGLEGRLIWRAFGQYISAAVPSPWSYLIVTAALYGAAALFLLHHAGLLGSAVPGSLPATAGAALLVLCACGGAFVAGVPAAVMPAPLVAASGLVLWYESGQLRDYAVFAAGAALTSAWFLHHHFWFLEVSLAHVSLRYICKLLLAGVVAGAALPGIVYSCSAPPLTAVLLIIQAVVMAAVEENLYAGSYDEAATDVYPAVLVVLTSVAGICLVRRLLQGARLGSAAAWLLQCIYAAKLSMLAIPQARLTLPVLLVVLAVTPPLLLHSAGEFGAYNGEHMRKGQTAPTWQGLVQAGGVALAVLHARFALFEVLQRVAGGRPTEAVLVGCLLLGVAFGCVPIVAYQHRTSQRARRWLALFAASGALLVLLRPPLPFKGGVGCPSLPLGFCPRLWDEAHVPGVEEDDVAIYSEALVRQRHWPLWLLIGAALGGVGAATGLPASRPRQAVGRRLAFAGFHGFLVGGFLMLELFPGELLVQVLVLLGTMAAASIVGMLHMRAPPWALAWLPWVTALWVLMLPVAVFLQGSLPLPPVPGEEELLFTEGVFLRDAERYANQRAALLTVWAAEALLLAFALKLKVSGALAAVDSPMPTQAASYQAGRVYTHQAAGFLGACMPQGLLLHAPGTVAQLRGPGGAAMQSLAAEGLAWVPTGGTLCTLLCFALSLALNSRYSQGTNEAVFVLAPILLLLNQDPLLCRGLTPERRYFPPVCATTLYLAANAVTAAIMKHSVSSQRGSAAKLNNLIGTWDLIKSLVLVLATLPNLLIFLRYMWIGLGPSGHVLVALAPFSAFAALLTDSSSVRLLAGLAILAAGVQFSLVSAFRRQGMKLI